MHRGDGTEEGPRTEILIRRRVADRYELSEGNWYTFIAAGNCYIPCPEMGIKDTSADDFTLFQHGCGQHEEMVNRVSALLEQGWSPERIVREWDDDAQDWKMGAEDA